MADTNEFGGKAARRLAVGAGVTGRAAFIKMWQMMLINLKFLENLSSAYIEAALLLELTLFKRNESVQEDGNALQRAQIACPRLTFSMKWLCLRD
jgi:hypothetical protein